MGLLWSKFDMRGQGFTRKFIDDVGQERPYEIEILTKEGHEYFMEYVLPTIPFGKSRIDPSEEDRKRGVRGYSIYRVELTQI